LIGCPACLSGGAGQADNEVKRVVVVMWHLKKRYPYIGIFILAVMSLVGSFFFRPAQAQLEGSPALAGAIREIIQVQVQEEKRIAFPALSFQEQRDSVSTYDHWIKAACRKYSLDPALVKAVIHAESQFDPWAISPKGAIGLMQLHPITARELGVKDPFNPKYNIDGGVRYLRDLLKSFEGDQHLALAAYNAGPGRVYRHKGVPPFKDTRNYLARVFRYLAYYQKDRVG